MRCHEARTLCGPYLDSELDAKTSFEIEQHLGACSECSRVFEAERKLDERIFASLRAGRRTEMLWQQIEASVAAPSVFSQGWFRRSAKPAVLVAAVIALMLTMVWLAPESGELDMAAAVARDHAKHAEGTLRPQFHTQPPAEAIVREQGRLDAEAFSKLPAKAGFRFEGKRVCHLSGVPVAWILGRDGDLPVSVVVLRRSELGNFPQLRKRLESGHAIICARTGRFQFAARVVGDHVVCAIAQTSRAKLENLIKVVPGSG